MSERLISSEANAKRISQIDQCFAGTTCQSLSKPGRMLVGEGILLKVCRKKAKRRQVFLFNDIFVYANIILGNKKFNKQTTIPLEQMKAISLDDDSYSGYMNGWQIISPMKSFVLFASTPQEKHNWLKYINVCKQKFLSSRSINTSVPLSSSSHFESSPVWVPDSEATVCMQCKKSEFTFLNRRHHCRKCGIVCCSECSERKYLLPNLSSKPVRVCMTCFNNLTILSLQKSMHGKTLLDSFSDSDSDDERSRWSGAVDSDERSESLFYSDPSSWK